MRHSYLLLAAAVAGGCAVKYQAEVDLPLGGDWKASNIPGVVATPAASSLLREKLPEATGASALAAAVVNAEGFLEVAVVGRQSSTGGPPLPLRAPFHVGSVAKPMAATLIARLVDDGALRWDEPLINWFPFADAAYDPPLYPTCYATRPGLLRWQTKPTWLPFPTSRGRSRTGASEWPSGC